MTNHTGPWYQRQEKRDAIVAFLRHIWANPQDGLSCLGKDTGDKNAEALFETHGGIAVPTDEGARVIVFAAGEKALKPGSSVIIELPPPGWPKDDGGQLTTPTDDQLLKLVLGNYVHW
jgi:hypothetical protein